jgi:AraC-like DNA-binding protein
MALRVSIHPALAPYISEILVDDAAAPPGRAAETYRVLPKPFPVLGFQTRGRLRVIREGGPSEPLSRAGITGVQSAFRHFEAEPGTRGVLVSFTPFGAYPLLGSAMSELADRHVGLGDLLPPAGLASLEERLAEAPSSAAAAAIVESFFLSRLDGSRRVVHPVVLEAAGRIVAERGGERIEALARDLAVSRRQMERLFQLQIGVGPKRFASLVRLHWVLEELPRRRSWADLAFTAGYSDQAHFVRSFTEAVGVPPGRFV